MEHKMNIIKVRADKEDNPCCKSKMFIFLKGENLLQNLANRHDRPYKLYKEEIVPLVVKELKAQGIDMEGMKVLWSQRAGCSCGCSPGFIIPQLHGYEIYVDVEVIEIWKDENEEAK
jgi:hypothetical protein